MLDFFSSRKAIAVRRLRLVSRKLTATLTRGKILWLFHPPGKASFLRKFSLLQGLPEKMCIQVLNLSFLHSLDALHNKHLREGGRKFIYSKQFYDPARSTRNVYECSSQTHHCTISTLIRKHNAKEVEKAFTCSVVYDERKSIKELPKLLAIDSNKWSVITTTNSTRHRVMSFWQVST